MGPTELCGFEHCQEREFLEVIVPHYTEADLAPGVAQCLGCLVWRLAWLSPAGECEEGCRVTAETFRDQPAGAAGLAVLTLPAAAFEGLGLVEARAPLDDGAFAAVRNRCLSKKERALGLTVGAFSVSGSWRRAWQGSPLFVVGAW